jgi:hypothetical protein
MGFKCEWNEDTKKRSDYDLVIVGEATVEIKNDLYAAKSGNVAIEYNNPRSGKPSGINITKSDIWCHIIGDEIFVVKTNTLKQFMECEKALRTVKRAGDGNADLKLYTVEHIKTILLPIARIREIL